MRYDLKFTDILQPWAKGRNDFSKLHSFSELLPVWPIWKSKSDVDIIMFQKHSKLRNDNVQRCLPQDVFFVARAARLDSLNGFTAAWPFQGSHPRRNFLTGDNRDHYEATLLGPAIDRRARIAVLFSCGSTDCWALNRSKVAVFAHASTTPHSHPAKAHINAPAKIPSTSRVHAAAPAKSAHAKSPHDPHSSPTSGRKSSSGHRGLLHNAIVTDSLYSLVSHL